MKKSWGVIKSIINKKQKTHNQGRLKIGKNLITSDNELISNKFNDIFINIGPTLAESIPHINKSPLSYLGNRLLEAMYLAPVNKNKIGQLIKSLKDSTAGFDDLNSMCLKISSQFPVKPLSHICNLSLSLKVFFQNSWRLQMLSIYIKVMILCCSTTTDMYLYYVLSKTFGKIMYNKIIAFLEICQILHVHSNQYGFRKKSSTHIALLTFIDKVIQAIDNGEYAIGVFGFFAKAFDNVGHKFLLDKLDHFGIRGCALSWFRSYLSHVLQYVTYYGSQSSQQLISMEYHRCLFRSLTLFDLYKWSLYCVQKHWTGVVRWWYQPVFKWF